MISSYFKNNFQILCFSVCAARNEIMGSQERVTLYYLIRSYSTISLLFTRINITNTCTCMLILSILGFWLSSVKYSLCQGQFPTKECCQDWFLVLPIISGFFQNPDFSFQSEQKLFKTATQNTFVSLELNHYHSTVSLISLNLRTFQYSVYAQEYKRIF